MKEPFLTKRNNFHGLNHVSTIQKYIEVICQADDMHQVVLLDDCSGLFNDLSAMAILKAATCPSLNNKRIVKWVPHQIVLQHLNLKIL